MVKLSANVFRSQAAKNHIYALLMFIDRDEAWKIAKENAASFFQM